MKKKLVPELEGTNCWFSRPFPIYMFARYFDINKPIVGGNWNPRDYMTEEDWNWFTGFVDTNGVNHDLYVIIGRSNTDNKFNVKFNDLVNRIDTIINEKNNKDFLYGSSGKLMSHYHDCFVIQNVKNFDFENQLTSWVIIATPEIFAEMGLTAGPCLDYLKVQENSKITIISNNKD